MFVDCNAFLILLVLLAIPSLITRLIGLSDCLTSRSRATSNTRYQGRVADSLTTWNAIFVDYNSFLVLLVLCSSLQLCPRTASGHCADVVYHHRHFNMHFIFLHIMDTSWSTWAHMNGPNEIKKRNYLKKD